MVEPSGDAYYLTRTALFNRCNQTPWALASQCFQDDPRPLDITWVRLENQQFLASLAGIDDAEERGLIFHDYALMRHWLHEDARPAEAELLRYSYVSVLRGWGFDSSGRYGAVLKGWAESRFGLRAIYHGGSLAGAQEAWDRYEADRMHGAVRGVGTQLDLLYTFCQDELARRHAGERWLTLYRGTHDPEAYTVKEGGAAGEEVVEFNTLSSFTADREVAWEFGSRVWAVRVPLAKIVFFSGLLPRSLLRGEQEYIVLGGDYRVRSLVC